MKKKKVTKATSAIPSLQPAGDYGMRLNSGGLTQEQVMSTVRRARMAMMQIRRKKHPKPMMDSCRMWIIEATVERVILTGMSAWMVTMWMRR
jgi:hypothetical protein